jgi:FRG domain
MEAPVTTIAEVVWDPWSTRIDSWQSAVERIDTVARRCQDKITVWRGMADARWSLHSSLSRKISALTETAPDEKGLQRYELEILERCRHDWRYDQLPALELLAHLQHFGGPTRLLDVSLNPLVALWFAVEEKYDAAGQPLPLVDGRLFSFAVKHRIALDARWGSRELPWQGESATSDWGRATSALRFWVPPAYNERISAQNAGFIIGGLPMSWAGGNRWRKGPGTGTGFWDIKTIRAASSLYLRPADLSRQPPQSSYPTYNFRVAASAKADIRRTLEQRYGFRTSSIYPDLFALAQNVLPTSLG